MSTLRIWRVQISRGDDGFVNTISVAADCSIPVIFTQQQFTMLFPDISIEDVPLVPKTGRITIKGEIAL